MASSRKLNGIQISFSDDQQTLELAGALTRETIPAIWSQWLSDVNGKAISRVDVSKVDAVDTAGVALLLEVVKAQNVTSIECVGASQQLQQIAAVSGVEGVLSLS